VSNHTVPDIVSLVQNDYLDIIIDQVGGAKGRVQVYIVATPS